MTARQEILEVVRELTERGRTPFSPREVVEELRRRGTEYADSTIRTHVVDVMCVDAGYERVTSYPDLRRVGPGQYVLAGPDGPSQSHPSEETRPQVADEGVPTRPWSWEGNVQDTFVRFLADQGWTIVSTADTAARQQGADVVARRDDRTLIVEVKGYPDSAKASVATQARHYVGGALLTALLAWSEHPEASVGLVFPEAITYRTLVRRLHAALQHLAISVWFVHEDGRVECEIDAA